MSYLSSAVSQSTGFLATCARCGQGIRNVYTYRGETYGPDCIHVVTGAPVDHWVIRRGAIDEAATAEREAAKVARQAEIDAERAARAVAAEALAAGHNAPVIAFLAPYIGKFDHLTGSFVYSVSQDLKRGLHAHDISPKAKDIICDMAGKEAGRRGSRKYNDAWMAMAEILHDPDSLSR